MFETPSQQRKDLTASTTERMLDFSMEKQLSNPASFGSIEFPNKTPNKMFAHVVTIAAVLFIGHSNAYKGWIKYPSGNLYFLFNKVPAPWDRAKKACILNGGYLAEPVNSAIDTFLRRQVSQRAAKDWWLGATDQHKEG